MTETTKALEEFDRVMSAGGSVAEALFAASEVMEMDVVAALNFLLGKGLSFEFQRDESWKNKEQLFLVRR